MEPVWSFSDCSVSAAVILAANPQFGISVTPAIWTKMHAYVPCGKNTNKEGKAALAFLLLLGFITLSP